MSVKVIPPSCLKIEYNCPDCGKQENLSIALERSPGKTREYYICKCGWEGTTLITKNEWKNIKRTRLIDRMTKMIKMTLHD